MVSNQTRGVRENFTEVKFNLGFKEGVGFSSKKGLEGMKRGYHVEKIEYLVAQNCA